MICACLQGQENRSLNLKVEQLGRQTTVLKATATVTAEQVRQMQEMVQEKVHQMVHEQVETQLRLDSCQSLTGSAATTMAGAVAATVTTRQQQLDLL